MRHVRSQRGVALVLVLWIIMVLSLLIAGFAFTMHVETQVASFNRKQTKAETLARSGIEYLRMQLLLNEQSITNSQYDALNQAWATNELFIDHELGEGKFTLKVTDEESKLPLNVLPQDQLRRVMEVLGVDASDADVLVDSIMDWREPGDLHRLNGAKSDYYQSLSPPYRCKNGPFERVDELLLVRGVTRELYNGGGTSTTNDAPLPGLKDLFTTTSSGLINVNTATRPVLQALLQDDTRVDQVLAIRDGGDGTPGTDDDQPFRTVADFLKQAGIPAGSLQTQLTSLLTVKSAFFTVKSTGEVGGVKRTITATLQRQNGSVVPVVWNERPGGG